MPHDSSAYVRTAVLALLAAAPEMVALVPAERHYPGQRPPNPTWPFLAYGRPTTEPFVASGLDGSTTSVSVHNYAETTGQGADTVPGEDMATAINAVVVATLGGENGLEIDLQAVAECPYPARAYISWTRAQVVQDGSDANAFHGWADFDITVTS